LDYWRGSTMMLAMATGAALFWAATPGVHAGEGRAEGGRSAWAGDGYPYLVVDQSLRDVLQEFGRNVRVDIQVSDRLKGRVNRFQHNDTAQAFLDELASLHGFDWFFDGRRLHVSSGDEAFDRTWSVKPTVEKELRAALERAGADDLRYPVSFDPDRGMARLSGPPAFMAVAMPVVERFVEPAVARTVNVIHGRGRSGGS
jgi:type III secretion protein C